MENDHRHEAGEHRFGTGVESRKPGRTFLVWIAVFGGIILLMLFRDRMESESELLSQYDFEQKVESHQIAQATINYSSQNPYLTEIVGKYFKTGTAEDHSKKTDQAEMITFRAKVRLTPQLENKLLSMPQFQAREANTMFLSVIWSVLPIVIIVGLIWFFFIRQIRRVSRDSPSTPDLQARTAAQQDRFDKIMDKWEDQACRMDAVLAKREGDK
jgi:cell division protease FtsH